MERRYSQIFLHRNSGKGARFGRVDRLAILGQMEHVIFLVNNRTMLPGSGKDDETDDPSVKISIDELIVKVRVGKRQMLFSTVLYSIARITLEKVKARHPRVRMVSCTLKNTLPGQEICKVYPDDAPDLSNFEKDLDVPYYSQMVRDYKIANRICSPTSVAMVLSYYGFDVSPEK